ncbi:hypothetical protein M0R04_07545 [Candidatus Dojkabacteria bacterium]|jgi:hypothetical protein|nr:hypothetical protein [Candidatus Dojkabacteria bacterium]
MKLFEIVTPLESMTEKQQIALVSQDGKKIKQIPNPSVVVQTAAVKQYPNSIQYIKNPSEDVQLVAVTTNHMSLFVIINKCKIIPSEAVQVAAVSSSGYTIRWIKKPSEQVQLIAIHSDPDYLRFIKKPTEAVQLLAVTRSGCAIIELLDKGIKKFSDNVIRTALIDLNLIKYSNKWGAVKHYDDVVRALFPNNSLLMKKWIRYGQALRDE